TRAREHLLTLQQIAWLLVGTAVPVVLLVPTVTRYGFASVFETLASACQVNAPNATAIATIIARFLSFANFELRRFLRQTGDSPAELLAPESRSDPPRPGPGNPRSRAALPDTARSLPAQAAQARGRPMPERPRARHRDGPAHLGIPSLHVAPPLARNYYLLCPIALLL